MSIIQNIYVNFRAALRLLLFILVISSFLVVASVVYILNTDPIMRRKKIIRNTQFFCKLIMKSFGVTLVCHQGIDENESSLLVGNHMGFIDVVCLSSLQSAVFITSLEMKNTPVLGQVSQLAGCAYVNRRSRTSIQEELKDLVRVLNEGFRIVLYPESVASNGEQVLPFKKTLMMAAGLSQKPIRPFVFNYRLVNGEPVTFEMRDSLCWYGDHGFLPAIWRSLRLHSVTCEVEFLPLVYVSPEADRTEVATKVHQMVSAKFDAFKPKSA
jgi:1-acyl-sn-glycerol-3-phosphate acyltransferase